VDYAILWKQRDRQIGRQWHFRSLLPQMLPRARIRLIFIRNFAHKVLISVGGRTRTRTLDPLIKSQF
jgi:hypothetical protein